MPDSAEHLGATDLLGDEEAVGLAEAMAAFAARSRRKRLCTRPAGELGVDELAQRTGITASAASQQLRVLRYLRMVTTRREGRRVLYRLHDEHIRDLLAAVRAHAEHAREDWVDPASKARNTDRARRGRV